MAKSWGTLHVLLIERKTKTKTEKNELVNTIASKNLDLIYLVFHAVTKENVLFLILLLPTQQLNAFAEADNRET